MHSYSKTMKFLFVYSGRKYIYILLSNLTDRWTVKRWLLIFVLKHNIILLLLFYVYYIVHTLSAKRVQEPLCVK